MSHIIGRPNDGLLDVMLGDGSDPEQAFIGGSQHDQEAADTPEDRQREEQPAGPEPTGPDPTTPAR